MKSKLNFTINEFTNWQTGEVSKSSILLVFNSLMLVYNWFCKITIFINCLLSLQKIVFLKSVKIKLDNRILTLQEENVLRLVTLNKKQLRQVYYVKSSHFQMQPKESNKSEKKKKINTTADSRKEKL